MYWITQWVRTLQGSTAVTRLNRIKKALLDEQGFSCFNAWQCPTFTWGDPTLSSALSVLTSEFEMDSGGSHSLKPPGNKVDLMESESIDLHWQNTIEVSQLTLTPLNHVR